MHNNINLRIGIDGNEANVENRVGSNQYAFSVLKALHRHTDQKFTIFLKAPPLGDMPLEASHWKYRVLRPTPLWTQWRLPLTLWLERNSFDVFYSPGHYAPRSSPIPTVPTILDISFLTYPNLFLHLKRGVAQLKSWTAYSVAQSTQVITISKHSKEDIMKHYHYPHDRIHIAYPGIDFSIFSTPESSRVKATLAKYQIKNPYLIYVGTLQPRKNLGRILKAFERLPRTHKELHWVIVGKTGWMYQKFLDQVQASPARDRIHLTGYAPAEDLPSLYAGAEASLLVGLHEGFGMPAAESLACGTIPIVSDTTSLPEVVGKAGVLVKPFSIESIRRGILTVRKLTPTQRKQRLEVGAQHVQQFSWSKAVDTILEVLHDVANQRQTGSAT